jgi:hypothetical protein
MKTALQGPCFQRIAPGTALALSSSEDLSDTINPKEMHMNTTISSKLTAVAAALLMNSLIMGAVGYLFEIQSHPHLSVVSFARQVATHQWFI